MPLYQQIIVTIPKLGEEALVSLFKRHTQVILSNGGVLRGIENHGVRPLAEKAKKKFASSDGSRYFWEARYVTATFDSSPKGLFESERLLRNEEGVLRFFSTKQLTTIDKCNSSSFKNPYFTKTKLF